MRCLLLAAHGSRRVESNREVEALADQLNPLVKRDYAHVQACFLELANPNISSAIDQAVSAGFTDIVLLPYFLAAGRHVVEDIPEIIAKAQSRHDNIQIRMTPYLGEHEQLPTLLAALAQS